MKAIALLALALVLPGCAVASVSKTPVGEHGRLQVSGNRIVGEHGRPVSLAGASLGWSQWESARFYNAGTVATLARDWDASIVRAALGIHPIGHLSGSGKDEARVNAVVEAAIASGLYVIIDWHDHFAHKRPEMVVEFFERMARAHGDKPNVIYEIYNEPLNNVSWSADLKPFAERVVAAIRAIDPDNLIVVGTPNWSQYVDEAAADPLSDPNVAYTLHFYAGTHKEWLRERALRAMDAGAALFVTEWGVCDANGDGAIDRESVREWLAFMREHGLSHCAWSIGDKAETASMLRPTADSDGGWSDADLTESGTLVREIVRGWSGAPR